MEIPLTQKQLKDNATLTAAFNAKVTAQGQSDKVMTEEDFFYSRIEPIISGMGPEAAEVTAQVITDVLRNAIAKGDDKTLKAFQDVAAAVEAVAADIEVKK